MRLHHHFKRAFVFLVPAALLCSSGISAQDKGVDSLWQLLKSPAVKKLSFQQLISVQRNYPNKDKALTIAYANELLSRNDLMAIDSLKATAYLEIGENYRNYGDNANAKKLLEESVTLFSASHNEIKRAEAIYRLGIYYANTDEDSIAIRLYMQSIEIAEKNNDSLGMVRPYRSLTGLFIKMGLFDKSLDYAYTGLKLAKSMHNDKAISALTNNIAGTFYKKDMFDSAIFYFKEALAINSRYEDYDDIIRNLSNLGTVYSHLEKLDSSAKYLGKAEELLPRIEVPRTFIYTYSAIAELKNKQTHYREAIGYANKAIQYSKQAGMEGLSDGAYECLVASYKGLHKPDSALAAFENYWAIKEKFLETGRNETVAKVEQQFQQYKKDNEITLLKKDRLLGETQRDAAFIAAGLLAIAAFLFYNRFRLKKKTSDALLQKNLEIEQQKEQIGQSLVEKETLLREIHHRVKNNLQIISSLLNIQSNHIQDESVLSSIREGQTRVQAMSLIHQNLYQSEHLNNVDIENYLHQLVAYLSTMFAGSDKSIKVDINANHVNFDIDTAIPLGLIVNELVSNAYKYAFEKHAPGSIAISIKPISATDYELEVADNGKGLPEGFNPDKSSSLGLKLVKALSKQLKGSFAAHSLNGTSFVVKFRHARALAVPA